MSKLFKQIVKSEIKHQLTRPLLYVFMGVVCFLAFNDITIISPTASGLITIGDVHHNSSLVIAELLAIISVLSIIIAPFIIAQALQKDFEYKTHGIIYSYPVTDTEYLWGRFWGAFLSFLVIPLAAIAGAGFGNVTLSEAFVGSFNLGAYAGSFFLIVLPGLLFSSLVLYLVTIKTRHNRTIYAATIILFLLFFLIQAFLGDQLRYATVETIQVLKWLTILDPFGISALNVASSDISVVEKNEFSLFSSSFLLLHRFIWLTACIGLIAVVQKSFIRTYSLEKTKSGKRTGTREITTPVRKLDPLPEVNIDYGFKSRLLSLLRLSWIDFKYSVFNIGFMLVVLLSLSSVHSNFNKNVESSGVYPTTEYFINNGMENTDLPILLLILFFTGVIIWKEKDYKFDTIFYSYPLSNTFVFMQKLLSISLMVIFYFAIVFVFAVISQSFIYGSDDISYQAYGHYLGGYSIFKYLVIATVFALFHVISHHKFMGYGLSVLGILFVLLSPSLGIDSFLLKPGVLPEVAYSHLNGLDPVRSINFWYRIYWFLFITILCIVGSMIWDRGDGLSLWKRISGSDVKMKTGVTVFTIGFIAIGGFIAVKSGSFLAGVSENQTYMEYEKKYRQYEDTLQPAIQRVSLEVDLFPSKLSGTVKGRYGLINNKDKTIDAVYISLINSDVTKLKLIDFNVEGTFEIMDEQIGFYVYSLKTPMQPGDTVSFSYVLTFDENEYKDREFNLELAQNGMILSSFTGQLKYFPQIGYKREIEIQDKESRTEHGLNPQPSTLISLDDSNQIKRRSRDMIHFEAIISTEEDQTAIATGNLVEEWKEKNRSYFHYKTLYPVNGEFGIVSGRYEKFTETSGELTVNIFYDETHSYNLNSIADGIIDSYRFNQANFERYGHASINIVEVPGYGIVNGTAVSKPTLILWNENGGFTADVSRMYIDRVYSTAVHEMAHQWWGHRLKSASFTEGQQLMYETVAQYIRLLALEKKYDAEKIQRFLDEENYYYKTGSSQFNEEELPIFRTNKGYIIYNKGTLVMDSLKTLLGEGKMNIILSEFYSAYAYKKDSPVSIDFVEFFKSESPDSVKESVDNLLTKPGLRE